MLTTLNFILGFVIAYWVYNDARDKNHEMGSALLWCIGALVMPIVFLPLYLLTGRNTKKANVVVRDNRDYRDDIIDIEAVPVDDMKNCPKCGKSVKTDYKACPYCAYALKTNCLKCGKEIETEWRMCPYCKEEVSR